MKLSEYLASIKQKEAELNRIQAFRDSIISSNITFFKPDSMTVVDHDLAYKTKLEEKLTRINLLNTSIDVLIADLIVMKTKINKLNVKFGLDEKLYEVGKIRMELSKLMGHVSKRRTFFEENTDISESFGINQRIKFLEDRKNKLDAEIQYINWNKNVV